MVELANEQCHTHTSQLWRQILRRIDWLTRETLPHDSAQKKAPARCVAQKQPTQPSASTPHPTTRHALTGSILPLHLAQPPLEHGAAAVAETLVVDAWAAGQRGVVHVPAGTGRAALVWPAGAPLGGEDFVAADCVHDDVGSAHFRF